jgi:hypothetical protein
MGAGLAGDLDGTQDAAKISEHNQFIYLIVKILQVFCLKKIVGAPVTVRVHRVEFSYYLLRHLSG